MEVKADQIQLLVPGRIKIPASTLRPERTVGVGQENGGFSGDSSRSPFWLRLQKAVWEGCWDFTEAVKGQECQIQKEKQTHNTLRTRTHLL